MVQPLALSSATNSGVNTSLSTMISFSVLDPRGTEISISTDYQNPIEIMIPRDPNFELPSMTPINVTTLHKSNEPFYFHSINITQSNPNLTAALHIEMRPLNSNLSYLLIAKFDGTPRLSTMITDIDDWSLFCYPSKYFFIAYLFHHFTIRYTK